ncbi:MAG TPA: hypothetical protein VGQ30_02355 [Gemmatimonadaceae bacterium]|nr:hypothetical protein [Gemmatimonadaceae bacterium]
MPDRAQSQTIDRSTFLRHAGGLFAIALIGRSKLASALEPRSPLPHPEPRDGITAEHVITVDALGTSHGAEVLEEYASARTYPALFDGIACGCSCGTGRKAEHRSLLACYETMQPTGCGGCQMEADVIGKLAKEGKSLADIRVAIDKMFG